MTNDTALPPRVRRMIDELAELKERSDKLVNFIESETYAQLDTTDQGLLSTQLSVMSAYISVLGTRIYRAHAA